MIVCAGKTEHFSFATPIGVGLIESAYNLSHIIFDRKPNRILFVGSCGSYGELNILDTFFSSSATQIEQSFLYKNSYTPIKNKIINDVSHETIVNSSNYITTDKDASTRYLEMGLGAENMEFYSVLWAAQTAGIEARGFFVVTNYCHQNGQTEYKNNLVKATDIIYDRYEKELKKYE